MNYTKAGRKQKASCAMLCRDPPNIFGKAIYSSLKSEINRNTRKRAALFYTWSQVVLSLSFFDLNMTGRSRKAYGSDSPFPFWLDRSPLSQSVSFSVQAAANNMLLLLLLLAEYCIAETIDSSQTNEIINPHALIVGLLAGAFVLVVIIFCTIYRRVINRYVVILLITF